jgi:hypothetical protein
MDSRPLLVEQNTIFWHSSSGQAGSRSWRRKWHPPIEAMFVELGAFHEVAHPRGVRFVTHRAHEVHVVRLAQFRQRFAGCWQEFQRRPVHTRHEHL